VKDGPRVNCKNTTAANGPLAGYRVLEIGSTVAGPFCGRMLADFGAEVIKIEPHEGDPVRTMGKQHEGRSLYASSIFRNKKLISLDLHQEKGRQTARALITRCDVLVENFKPGTLEKWGLGWDELSRRDPRLVMVRISGFGLDGPYSHRPGYGVVCEAVSGLRHLTGDPDRAPSRVGVSMTDYIAGLHGAYGAVMALMVREKTGRGQLIDAALYECAFNFMEAWIPAYDKLGFVPNRTGSRLIGSTPNNLYATGDGSHIHITAQADNLFHRLAAAMGQPELAKDARFSDHASRNRNYGALDEIIERWTLAFSLAELETVLQEASVPATRVYTIADIFNDPHYRARNAIVAAPDAHMGSVAMAGVVPRMSATPGMVRHAGHDIGEDTRPVLRELLGLTDAAIDELVGEGIVGETERHVNLVGRDRPTS
jgi:crotonobetainyl-CoA:carnitine CoA-transferase CaiB-like acyl-CoA transferase